MQHMFAQRSHLCKDSRRHSCTQAFEHEEPNIRSGCTALHSSDAKRPWANMAVPCAAVQQAPLSFSLRDTNTGSVGSRDDTAPEIIMHDQYDGRKAEIQSCGVL